MYGDISECDIVNPDPDPDPNPDPDCNSSTKAAGNNLKNVINNPNLTQKLANLPTSNGTEAGFIIGKNSAGSTIGGDIVTSNSSGSLNWNFNTSSAMPSINSSIHYHPNSNSMSAGDLRALAQVNEFFPSYISSFALGANGSMYAFYVTNPSALAQFLTDHENDIDAVGNFDANSDLGIKFNQIWENLFNNGATAIEAYEGAMAAILKENNIGVDLYKKDSDGNFEKSNTHQDSNGDYVNEKCPD